MSFHTDLADAEAARPGSLADTHALLGIGQATATTVRISDGRVVSLETLRRRRPDRRRYRPGRRRVPQRRADGQPA
jgi:hypothetical protein